MEAQHVLATIMQRFRLEIVRPKPIVGEPLVTLRLPGGLPMRLTSLPA